RNFMGCGSWGTPPASRKGANYRTIRRGWLRKMSRALPGRCNAATTSGGAQLDVSQHDRPGPGEKADAERGAQTPPPGQVLFRRHHSRDHEHPAEISHADDKHQQHQRPTATDAERPVFEAKSKGLAGARPCQRAATNANGVWHCSRQWYLSALHWNAPAPASTAAPIIQPLATNQLSRAAAKRSISSAPCARSPKASHTAKKPTTTSATSRPACGRSRVIRRNMAISGNAVGSIIAAIISIHADACSNAGTTILPCGTARQSAARA